MSYKLFSIMLALYWFLFLNYVNGSCLEYGHSCWGAHGKRSDQPALYSYGNVNLNNIKPKDLIRSKDLIDDLNKITIGNSADKNQPELLKKPLFYVKFLKQPLFNYDNKVADKKQLLINNPTHNFSNNYKIRSTVNALIKLWQKNFINQVKKQKGLQSQDNQQIE